MLMINIIIMNIDYNISKIKKFDLNQIQSNCLTAVFGNRDSMRSHLCIELINNKKNSTRVDIFKPSKINDEINICELLENQNNMQIYSDYDLEKLNGIIQEKQINNYKNISETTIVFYDIFNKNIFKNNDIYEIVMNGRHYKFNAIYVFQYPPFNMRPEIRCNIDYVFIFGTNDISLKKKYYDKFCGMFKTYEEFDKIFSHFTNNNMCIVINYKIKSHSLEDKFFWYAIDIPSDNMDIMDKIINMIHKLDIKNPIVDYV
jgi:hypothetical protein